MAVAGRPSENGVYEFPYVKPPERSTWEAIRTSLWNPSTREFFGRDAKSWGQLLLFYTIFYIVLGALFAISMKGLLATIDDKEPKWQQDYSLIGTNPGLGFRPISSRTEEGSLIWYNQKNKTTMTKWKLLIDEFLEPYRNSEGVKNRVQCDYDKRPESGQTCAVNVDDFGPCSPQEDYGYNSSSPCVFLKLNRIFGWVPNTYSDPNNLPADMPQSLKDHIKSLGSNANTKQKTDQIWVSCDGEYGVDKESLNGFEFYPSQGFSGYYYPYKNEDNYLSPLVAVRVIQPKVNVMVSIECRAWAKNINYRGGNLQREGSVHFEIMVDSQ